MKLPLPNFASLRMLAVSLSCAWLSTTLSAADFKLAGIFDNHMILQREKPVPIWGTANPNDTITADVNGQNHVTKAGADGRWKLVLDPMKASAAPVPFTISCGSKKVTLEDVLVGEVWFAAGQSNMTMPVREVQDAAKEMAAAEYPQIRQYEVMQRWPFAQPRETTDKGGSWVVCSPEKVGPFSATGYFFARELYRHFKVPVGIIHASAGGIAAETLTPPDALAGIPSLAYIVEARGIGYGPGITEEEWNRRKKAQEDFSKSMESPDTDDKSWEIVKSLVTERANRNASWFRFHFTAPATWKDQAALLHIVKVANISQLSVNGKRFYPSPASGIDFLEYKIPQGTLREGDNTIALRTGSYALNNTPANGCSLVMEKDHSITIDIPSQAYHKLETPDQVAPENLSLLGNLFNGMVAPYIPFQIRGVLWYQGESNVGKFKEYRELFSALIKGWRQHWEQPELPFCFVQLAGFMPPPKTPADNSDWAGLREAQAQALSLPATAMAVALDLGDAQLIHPKNKQEVGRRAALAALSKFYGETGVVGSGPTYVSHTVTDGKIRITFKDTAGGLAARDGAQLKGFAIAADQGNFEWADAQIADANTVIVSSDKIRSPSRVLYGWAHNLDANLMNKEGLPAVPFQTKKGN